MLNSLNACGTTLLDTINHVMDHAKIGESKKGTTSRLLKNANTVRLSSKPIKGRRRKEAAFDFATATEEVIEAVFSGSSYVPVATALVGGSKTHMDTTSASFQRRKICYIVFEMAPEEDWIYCFPVGSWRRIVMNLFGNAIKYTASGCTYDLVVAFAQSIIPGYLNPFHTALTIPMVQVLKMCLEHARSVFSVNVYVFLAISLFT